jgi:membrane-bound serine protease (ClpP class)
MTTVITLFIAGIVLIALEVVVPGAVLGIVGGLAMLIGVVVAFAEFGFDGGIVAFLAALIVACVALYLEFVLLPKSRLAKSLSMTGTIAGTSQPAIADRAHIVGREAIAVTALAPSGYVEIDGRRYEAFARDGLTRIGERLEVIDVDTFRLIVSKPSTATKQ